MTVEHCRTVREDGEECPGKRSGDDGQMDKPSIVVFRRRQYPKMEKVNGQADFTNPELRIDPRKDPGRIYKIVGYEMCTNTCSIADLFFFAKAQKIDLDDLEDIESVPTNT